MRSLDGLISIDCARRLVTTHHGGVTSFYVLSLTELKILTALAETPLRSWNRTELRVIAGNLHRDERIIDSFVKQIRHKLGDNARSPRYVLTVRGEGYCLSDQFQLCA
jgi:DNA-binding response OmpR family regulator